MWILDDSRFTFVFSSPTKNLIQRAEVNLQLDTILTSFPRRWGRNKPDPSGVHKSLRERLNHVENGRINSIFDLALIIIDQCSLVFFDRTKPTDQRPEVMDIFSTAIAHVVCTTRKSLQTEKLTDVPKTKTSLKTVAFENFWHQTRIDALRKNRDSADQEVVRTYLNINPEGALLNEIQDIMEELRMMSRIFNQQSQVVKEFKKALEKLADLETSQQQPHKLVEKLPRTISRVSLTQPSIPQVTIADAGDLINMISDRIAEIGELEEAAEHTSGQV